MCISPPIVVASLLVAATAVAAPPEPPPVPRPPRLPAGPRYFGRVVRPIEPRNSIAVQVGHTWGRREPAVDRDQWRWSFLAEYAYGRVGLFLEVPVVLDTARSGGVYGEAAAESAGLGDLRFGGGVRLIRFRLKGLHCAWGAGVQLTAPTGKERRVAPENLGVPVPAVSFGPALWTLSGGTGLSMGPLAGFSMQLNADLIGMLRDEEDRPNRKEDWLFVGLSTVFSYGGLPWLVPLVQIEAQLEIVGINPLRQLIFIGPALRIRPHSRVALDLGVRIPLGGESETEQAFSMGGVISVGMGRTGDRSW